MTAARQAVLQRLRQAVLAQEGGPTDGELMERFTARRDADALEALIRRHGPMVLAVCRRVLGDGPDAEDAFQAAFLVFVRKAASIRSRELVGNWLYGAAYRTALKARGAAARRRVVERRAATMNPTRAESDDGLTELLPLLDRELSRLPDKYRTAVVLCELEGRPRKEAARKLGVPEGTLSSRLATAKRMLARRLAKHGPTPTDGALATALARGTGLPPPLLASTAKAASLFAGGQAATAVASARVAALAEGVLKSMLLTKLAVGILAAVVVVTMGAAAVACRAPGAPVAADAAPADKPVAPAKGEKPADKPADGLTARIVAPKEVAADDPELKGELIVTNDGDAPVRVCTLAPGTDGLGGAFGQHFRPDWWKSDRPPLEASAKKVVTLAPGKGVSFPFTITQVHYKDRDSFTITGFYAVEDKEFAEKLGLWVGKAEAEPVKVEVGKESAWGEAVDGVQARVRTEKAVWKAGEPVRLHLDLRNQGKATPNARRVPFDCQIEVDGVWYSYDLPSGPYPAVGDPLEPGKQVDDWATVSPDKSWGSFPGKKDHFPLPPGKHTLRVAYPLNGDKPLRPVSGPVEIEVRQEGEWGEADDGVQARLRASKTAWDAGETPEFVLDMRNQGEKTPHQCRVPNFCEIEWDGQWYRFGGSGDLDCKHFFLNPGREVDDWVKPSLDIPWVRNDDKEKRLAVAAGKHTVRVAFRFDDGPRPVSQPVQVEVGKESAWGEAAGGVQARVRTPKAVWGAQEAPTLIVDLQNVGEGKPHSLHIPFGCEIEVDGTWYNYTGPVDVTSQDTVLEPGKQYPDWVTVKPDKFWLEKGLKSRPLRPLLPLSPGKHTIRILYPLDGEKPPLRPISGPIEIEVVKEPAGGAQPPPQPPKGAAPPPARAGGLPPVMENAVETRKRLNERIDYELVVQATLNKVIDSLLVLDGIPWTVNEAAITAAGQDKDLLKKAEIEKIDKQTGVTRATLLKMLLDKVHPEKGKIALTYVVRRDRIEITTEQAYRDEFYPGRKEAKLPPLVYSAFDGAPLREALKKLADEYEVNIVIDARVAEKANAKVTAEFATAPLDAAVAVLADMAGLEVVRLGTIYYVTSPEHARALRKGQEQHMPDAEEEERETDGSKPPVKP